MDCFILKLFEMGVFLAIVLTFFMLAATVFLFIGAVTMSIPTWFKRIRRYK